MPPSFLLMNVADRLTERLLRVAALLVVCGAGILPAADAADLLERGLQGWVVEGTIDFDDRGKKVHVWTFADGVVLCSGRGFGYLRYEEPVSDFRLELEYRFPKNGNSGIGIRTVPFTGPLETRPSQAAYEIQLLSDAGDKPGRGSCCSLYGHEAPKENRSRPIGEWNTIVVECRGPKIRIEHNGGEVLAFDPYLVPERNHDPRGEAHACVLGVAGASLVGLDMTSLHGTD